MRSLYLNVTLLLAFLLIAFSCTKKEELLTMEEERLIPLLLDAHIVEGALQPLYEAHKDSMMNVYYNQLFTIHQVDSSEFFHNLRVLRKNPDLGKKIYDKVMKAFNEMEASNKAGGKKKGTTK